MPSLSRSVLILDFGSQVSRLIARRVRELGVYCEIVPHFVALESFVRLSPCCVIFSGGPASVLDPDSPRAPIEIFESGVPLLGICYGQQVMCSQLGGVVESGEGREFGRADVEVLHPSALFSGIWKVGDSYPVWMSHGDRVVDLPSGFEIVATSAHAPCAVAHDESRNYYTTMFHPEVVHTPDGLGLLENFVCAISGASRQWTMSTYREKSISEIRDRVGDKRVICGLSGGVDSSVAALLVHEAIGSQLTCILVDHGLLRSNEASTVVSMFQDNYNIPLVCVDASDLFLSNLSGITDPEEKRKIIGKLFIDVFESESKKLGGADFLVQGTLYPDVIESISFAGGASHTIKTHHNVGGLPERMDLELIEPLRELFKDEVRVLGKELGLPSDFICRHPFPGPGLALRCLGEVTHKSLEMLRKADSIYLEELRVANLYDDIWQAFAVLLPVRTVGVMGDARTYEQVCSLRAVTSVDGMTADFYPFDMSFLARVSTRIINEVEGINRVVYDITSKPPGTIEWE